MTRLKTLICIMVLAMGLSFTGTLTAQAVPTPPYPYRYLATPYISTASNTASGVKLTWDSVFGAEKYRVFVRNGSSWKKLGDTAGNVYYHKAAVSGVTYTYTIRCVSADGSTFTSDYVAAGKTIKFIKMPVISSLETVSNGIKISWDAVAGAAKYRLFYKNGTSWKKIGDTASTSYVYTSVTAGKSYIFTIRCISADGKSFTSAYESSGKTTAYVKTPSITSITDEVNGVKLTWSACTGAAKYRVFVRRDGRWKTLAATTETSYTHNADIDTEYTYTVRCYTSKGYAASYYNTSGWTHKYVVTSTLEAPEITKVENARNGAKITWTPVEGAEKYRVFVRDNYEWVKLGDTESTAFTHTAAVSGTSYTYTVRCINNDATAYTSSYNAAGFSHTFVKMPAIQSVTNTSNGPLIIWDAGSGAAQYRLLVENNGAWVTLCDTTETAYLHTDAVNNTSYSYKVYCLDAEGYQLTPIPTSATANTYTRNTSNQMYSKAIFAAEVGAALSSDISGFSNPNAPLTRANAAEILYKALKYKKRTTMVLSDVTDNPALQTVAYFGYFLPDSSDRIYPDKYVTSTEYKSIMKEVNRYAQLKGKKVLSFGDSIMYGSGNSGHGMSRILAEKYGMAHTSYAVSGATFATCYDASHISDQIENAHNAGCTADIILINGGTNDMISIVRNYGLDTFDTKRPYNSNFSKGMELSMSLLNKYWNGVPVIYVRAQNVSASDSLEIPMGNHAINVAKSYGANTIDIFSDTSFNAEDPTIRDRYTKYKEANGYSDSVHPTALGYATFYMPLICNMTAKLLIG